MCRGLWTCVCVCVFVASYLEFICIVEADLHRWDHPGLEQRTQDTIGYCVGDEMKVERIPPEKWKERDVKVCSGEKKAAGLVRKHQRPHTPLHPVPYPKPHPDPYWTSSPQALTLITAWSGDSMIGKNHSFILLHIL